VEKIFGFGDYEMGGGVAFPDSYKIKAKKFGFYRSAKNGGLMFYFVIKSNKLGKYFWSHPIFIFPQISSRF
jgi:hypothetical protein